MSRKRKVTSVKPTTEEDNQELKQIEHQTKMTKKSITITNEQETIIEEEKATEETTIMTKATEQRQNSLHQEENQTPKKTTKAKSTVDKSDGDNLTNKKPGRPRKVKIDEETTADDIAAESGATGEKEGKQQDKDLVSSKIEKKATLEEEAKETPAREKDETESGNSKQKGKGYVKCQKMNRNRAELVSKLDDYKPVDQVIELGDGKIPTDNLLISSWNVAGLSNLLKKQDLQNYMKDRQPDIICLNETKLTEDHIKGAGAKWIPEGYSSYFNCCKIRKWYSGTALVTKYKPLSVTFDIGIKKHDLEGRTITAEFENFYLVVCYVPNAGEDLVGLKYRVEEWDLDFRNYVAELKKKKHVVICGDLNCAYGNIDIHRTDGKEKCAGFSPEERKSFGELLECGFVDTFRLLHPTLKKFSFFSLKLKNRPKNKGWRLDYFLVDKEGINNVKESLINDKIYGSDHLPIEMVLNPSFNETVSNIDNHKSMEQVIEFGNSNINKLEKSKSMKQAIELGDGKIPTDNLLISSWNVAGLYNMLKKQDLQNYMKDRQPDIICLNETKLTEEYVKGVGTKWIPKGYSSYFNCCKTRTWYSGTALVTKYKPLSVTFDIGIQKHDLEGRTITAEFDNFYLVVCYVSNAGEDLAGLKYRVEEWDPDFRKYVAELKNKKHVVICGDLNCAYGDIDIYETKGKEKCAGFSPEERKSFGELLECGFVDTFRHLNPTQQKFSFFSLKLKNRPKNKGWRLDYFLVDKEGVNSVKESLINDKIYGSDHLPIEMVLNPSFT